MTDSASTNLASAPASAPAASPTFSVNPVPLLMAIADGVRWAVLRELASGQPLSVQDLGARLRRDPNLISKHLRVLRAAGAVVEVQAAGLDGRKTFHTVPEIYRRTDAAGRPMIDYGSCALRFG